MGVGVLVVVVVSVINWTRDDWIACMGRGVGPLIGMPSLTGTAGIIIVKGRM